jgi:hypothetical protein
MVLASQLAATSMSTSRPRWSVPATATVSTRLARRPAETYTWSMSISGGIDGESAG